MARSKTQAFETELRRRLDQPQRHRLLHGYPMAPLLEACAPDPERLACYPTRRPLIVGVLPHPFCNPRVTGCGFCTFPHAAFQRDHARRCTRAVCAEIEALHARLPRLFERRVEAVYLGGGTANLTPEDELRALLATLQDRFDLREAELTLEGVPVYFAVKEHRLLDLLAECCEVGQLRISMGVQTFDPDWIERMGRQAYGDRELVGGIVEAAHARGLRVSADLLCNLPGQELGAMEEDVDTAIALGLDQICLYHLVLFEGLGVPWAEDPTMLGALPANDRAFESWAALRRRLLEAGYLQTTLTNFEKVAVHASAGRFRYEACSFAPATFDGLGFGPGAITSLQDFADETFVKLLNAGDPARYGALVEAGGCAHTRRFHGYPTDLRLLFLTRSLAALGIDPLLYRHLFDSTLRRDFPGIPGVLSKAGLLVEDARGFRLSERGMFFADSVAGLLAWPRTQNLRGLQGFARDYDRNESLAARSPMG